MLRPSRLVLLGQPVAHSLSPVFQNAALRACGLPLTYAACDVGAAQLEPTLRELVAAGAAGNATIPHKEQVASICDVLTPLAQRLGAVNTWWTSDGLLHGDNTDVGGFDDAVIALLGGIPTHAKVAVLGAGGSARAVVAAVSAWPRSRVAIWSRTAARADALVALGPSGATTVEEFMAHALHGADLVVNTTPIGMQDEQVPVNPAVLRDGAACIDLVYRRHGVTPFVQLARAQGRRADDGLPMLIAQGARAWQRWFGDIVPDRALMLRAALGRAPDGDADGAGSR
ncbi:MAG TPA: shikimate dehydrogenase [Gemmatimonadaceae bacterium]|nr:shikimate dehydrogenase [Gemmatimonadaceae bacterium]